MIKIPDSYNISKLDYRATTAQGVSSEPERDHYLIYEGIRVRRPTMTGKIDWEFGMAGYSLEDKLREKFSWLKTPLDFEGLKELDIWWESMIYKEENYDSI